MPANTSPIFPVALKSARVAIVNADGTTSKAFLSAGTNGSRIDTISAVSDDTSDVVLQIVLNDGTSDSIVGEIKVPAGAGTNGTVKAIKVLNSTDLPWLDASGALFIAATWSLKVKPKTAVTTAKTVTLVASGGDY